MSEPIELNVRASERIYDELEPYLTRGSVNYERSGMVNFSMDAPTSTVVIISCVAIQALAPVLATYLKERKRRISVAKTDGTKLTAENYSTEEVERILRASADDGYKTLYIDDGNTERRFTMPGFDDTKPFNLTTRDGIKLALALLLPFGPVAVPVTYLLSELISKLIPSTRVPTEDQVAAAERLIRTGKEMGVSKFRFEVSRDVGVSLSTGKIASAPPIKVVAGTSETMILEVEYK